MILEQMSSASNKARMLLQMSSYALMEWGEVIPSQIRYCSVPGLLCLVLPPSLEMRHKRCQQACPGAQPQQGNLEGM
jgi:hypothetical protein